jgi:hypothetical protein
MNEILILDDTKDLNMILDDTKDFELDNHVIVCKSYDVGIKYITEKGLPNTLYLDYNLGEVKTGYDFLKYIFLAFSREQILNCEIICISNNANDKNIIIQALDRYKQSKGIKLLNLR